MRPSDGSPASLTSRRRPDYLGWLALAWAIAFGILYAEMMIRARAPGLAAAIRRIMNG
jgi:hypothetical protein